MSEGLFFECVDTSTYEPGTVVEMVNIGPALWRDDEERLREPFIWARSGDEPHGFWYFRSKSLRPLTVEACDAYADLIELEAAWERARDLVHKDEWSLG